MKHPFAQHPHRYPAPPANYVGPAWAAPQGHAQLRPVADVKRARRWFRMTWSVACFIVFISVWVSEVVDQDSTGQGPQGRRDRHDTSTADVNDPAVILETGHCSAARHNERTNDSYVAFRRKGSARRLRGNVSIIHLRLRSKFGSWSRRRKIATEAAAIATGRWFMREGHRRGHSDLDVTSTVHDLSSTIRMSRLLLKSNGLPSRGDLKTLMDMTKLAIETALGTRLTEVVAAVQDEGADEVAILAYMPVSSDSRSRSVAQRSATRPPPVVPELAYIFTADRSAPSFASTIAHESLHLFGAADLYSVKPSDTRDENDIMAQRCIGFQETQIREMTEFAIGWRTAPPLRDYPLEDK